MRRFHRRPRLIELSMPRQPGEAAILRAWRQKRNALPDDVRAVLAAADLAAERTAARVRLCVLILIGLVLVGLGSVAGVYREWIATIFALNLAFQLPRSCWPARRSSGHGCHGSWRRWTPGWCSAS